MGISVRSAAPVTINGAEALPETVTQSNGDFLNQPSVTYQSATTDRITTATGNYMSGVLGKNGKVYLISWNGDLPILEYSPATHTTVAKIAPNSGIDLAYRGSFGKAIHGAGNTIVLTPAGCKRVVVYDYVLNQIAGIYGSTDITETFDSGTQAGSVLYFSPRNTYRMLTFNTTNNTVGYTSAIPGVATGATNVFKGCIADIKHNIIWMISYGYNGLLKYTPSNDTWTVVETSASSHAEYAQTTKWSGAAFGKDGNLYFTPMNCTKILKLNRNASSSNTGTEMIGAFASTSMYYGAVQGIDGNIYAPAFNASRMLIIDLNTGTPVLKTSDTAMLFDSSTGKYVGGVLTANGTIVCIPQAAGKLMRVRPVWNGMLFTSGLNRG